MTKYYLIIILMMSITITLSQSVTLLPKLNFGHFNIFDYDIAIWFTIITDPFISYKLRFNDVDFNYTMGQHFIKLSLKMVLFVIISKVCRNNVSTDFWHQCELLTFEDALIWIRYTVWGFYSCFVFRCSILEFVKSIRNVYVLFRNKL